MKNVGNITTSAVRAIYAQLFSLELGYDREKVRSLARRVWGGACRGVHQPVYVELKEFVVATELGRLRDESNTNE